MFESELKFSMSNENLALCNFFLQKYCYFTVRRGSVSLAKQSVWTKMFEFEALKFKSSMSYQKHAVSKILLQKYSSFTVGRDSTSLAKQWL